MNLSEIQQTIDFSNCEPNIEKILSEIKLLDFKRNRNGQFQTFHFHFQYKEKKYTLEHSFSYHGTGVENWFKFRKESFFSPKPFSLNNTELCLLSNELMKVVNKYNN